MEKDYIEFQNNGKTYIKSIGGDVVCQVSYDSAEEYLCVVNNPVLIRISGIWKECEVKRYKDSHLYYTDFGAIKRGSYMTDNNHLLPEKIVVQGIYGGYPQINIKNRNRKTHSLLGEELCGRSVDFIKEELSVDHINSKPWDNHLSNLRIISIHEQMNNDITKIKVSDAHTGIAHNKPSYRVVGECIESGEVVVFDNTKAAAEYCGFKDISRIVSVCNKSHNSTGGWKFYFWEEYYGKEDLLDGERFVGLYIDDVNIYKDEFPTITSNVQVSNFGRVRFLERTHWCYTCGNINNISKRYQVMIGGKNYKLARVVCLFFHPETYKPGLVVRHLDGDRCNNKPENLAWGTVRENQLDERYNSNRIIPIVCLDKNNKVIARYNSLSKAERIDGYKTQHTSLVCRGIRETYKGVKFMYERDYCSQGLFPYISL